MSRTQSALLQFVPWVLIIAGALTAARAVDTRSFIIGISLAALGFGCLEVLLFFKPRNDHLGRPAGQMVIATGLTLLLNAIPIALLQSATRLANAAAEQAQRFQLPDVETRDIRLAGTSSLAVLILVVWTIALPIYAWWRWFGAAKNRADA